MKIQMVRDAKKADKEHLFDLRTKMIGDLYPFTAPAAELRSPHLEFDRKVMDAQLS